MDPSLQIDVPQEQADRILEKRRELGPYIFREAQVRHQSSCLSVYLWVDAVSVDGIPNTV